MTYFITCDFICFCVKCVAFRFLDYPHDGFVNLVDNNFWIIMKKNVFLMKITTVKLKPLKILLKFLYSESYGE